MPHKRPRLLRVARVRLHRWSRRLERHTPEWMKWLTPWGTSLVLHGMMLMTLGLVYYAGSSGRDDGAHIESTFPAQLKEDIDALRASDHAGDPFTSLRSEEPPSIAPEIDPASDVIAVAEMPPAIRLADKLDLRPPAPRAKDSGRMAESSGRLAEGPGAGVGLGVGGEFVTPFAGRQGAARAKLVRSEGGSVQSEKAVERGLDWLARHQHHDGHWSLNHRMRCRGAGCPPDRAMEADAAATGLALLPLLGAGHTHTEPGRYQKVVDAGLKWLVGAQRPDGELSISGGNTRMYSHAIATMALSEAYGLTKDTQLEEPAQRAVWFIALAQNPDDGGWRYSPGQAGDTSVFGWQMFALRSAHLAGLDVPPDAIRGCRQYLDRAATDPPGSSYSYLPGGPPSLVMTAEALLSRQFLGWPRAAPALQAGAGRVAADMIENRQRNIYYWYYGTQLLHNMQGPAWTVWNKKVRDGLVALQVVSKECDQGSWHPTVPVPDVWGKDAGRHFVTSLSILTLEVYYRYLPLYRERDKNPVQARDEDAVAKAAEER